MATIIKDTVLVLEESKFDKFMEPMYKKTHKSSNPRAQETSRRINAMKQLNVDGRIIKL